MVFLLLLEGMIIYEVWLHSNIPFIAYSLLLMPVKRTIQCCDVQFCFMIQSCSAAWTLFLFLLVIQVYELWWIWKSICQIIIIFLSFSCTLPIIIPAPLLLYLSVAISLPVVSLIISTLHPTLSFSCHLLSFPSPLLHRLLHLDLSCYFVLHFKPHC